MPRGISHDRREETPEAKARWFASLSEQDRMEILDELCEFFLQANPRGAVTKDAYPSSARVRVVESP